MGGKWFWGLTVLMTCVTTAVLANVQSKVRCFKDFMEVDIVRTKNDAQIYLEQLKNYPDEACKPVINNGVATFRLSLDDVNMLRCGMARIVDEMTGRKIYYHRIIVEDPSGLGKQTFMVKCIVMEMNMFNKTNHKIVRKSVLPAGFQEDDSIDVRGVIKGCAPIPMLSVGVRQGGNLVTGELNVSPGTPLQMEIFLDSEAAPVYGLLATYMQVTDTKSAEETIIFNGCSVDPYLFENFDTVDGDFLTAKFRAFKFPESTYVQFRGTVNVCLDKCSGIECSNGQIGFGRRRRSISKINDKNRVFQVTMSTFIKVDYDRDVVLDEELSQFIRRGKNRTMEQRPVIGEQVREQFLYKLSETETNGTKNIVISNILLLILTFCHFSGYFLK